MLADDLAGHTILGIDTSPFIYFWERHARYYPLAETLFSYLSQPHVEGVTSIITLIEVSIHPQRHGRMDLVQAYENALLYSRQVRTLPVDAPLARRAVALRAHNNDIHIPDALQLAAALHAGATVFVTNDRRLSSVEDIAVLVLDDYRA